MNKNTKEGANFTKRPQNDLRQVKYQRNCRYGLRKVQGIAKKVCISNLKTINRNKSRKNWYLFFNGSFIFNFFIFLRLEERYWKRSFRESNNFLDIRDKNFVPSAFPLNHYDLPSVFSCLFFWVYSGPCFHFFPLESNIFILSWLNLLFQQNNTALIWRHVRPSKK